MGNDSPTTVTTGGASHAVNRTSASCKGIVECACLATIVG